MQFFSRHWRIPKAIWVLFIVEFPLTIALLTIFGIASPNTYRTKLWQEGADHGFNSDPLVVLYSYANYRPVKTPIVWSSFMTEFNLVISVISMFLLLTKVVLHVLHLFWPIISFVCHGLLVGLFSYSIYVQTAPDVSDPKHPNNGAPWYIMKNCNFSSTSEIKGFCEQAKAGFAVTVVMLALFVVNLLLAIWSNFTARKSTTRDSDSIRETKSGYSYSPQSEAAAEQQWEFQTLQRPEEAGGLRNPMTPRSKAFQDLAGASQSDLPLRNGGPVR
ncbi:hypothetical protein K402DRAFT_465315 [Aulographum hederae CBS 113979]|uniref:MARVEL domain-containing protein n=1 Tax=Aulographum hederae CBS 113979 TaxID=1176131 RepID=A0A6G1GTS1_9PEZI|nr:hypothetical protein K402DRAFT_465315 [Aulographum hederae CBS 113979]